MARVFVYQPMKLCFDIRSCLRHACLMKNVNFGTKYCYYNTSSFLKDVTNDENKTIEDHYLNPHVQQILKRITGLDYEKVFHPIQQPLQPPEYKFVTDKELEKMKASAYHKAMDKLQMPPVMQAREPINEIIAKNPEVQGCETHKIVFTDISDSVNNRDRVIVVREPDGTLRQATWDERTRMNQIYFPVPGRKLIMPKFFERDRVQELLDKNSYLFVLDSTCAQFEPDDPEYITVTHIAYDHINKQKKFDVLRSTRHFGPMAFYLAYSNKIEKLLIDMIERELVDDAVDLIKLMYILHPEMRSNIDLEQNDVDIIKQFDAKNTSVYKADLELAVQTFCEAQKHKINSETVA